MGRIIVSGSNNYNDPWRIDNLPHELKNHFNSEAFKEFTKVRAGHQELEEALGWSTTIKIICIVLNWVNLSPSFLFLQRLLRSSRVKRMTRVLNKQTNYKQEGLFKKDRNYELKWTVTSDKSKLFLNIVNTDESQKNFLNWELPFPQKFLISSLGSSQSATGPTTNPSRWRSETPR